MTRKPSGSPPAPGRGEPARDPFAGPPDIPVARGADMTIGQAARASGVTAKMVRHYESIGLLPPAARTDAGYRQYGDKDVETLRFIRHGRDLGFSLDQIGALLDLWRNRRRPSRQVKAFAEAHLQALDRKLAELQSMQATLRHLVQCCHGDERPDCPILASLAADDAAR